MNLAGSGTLSWRKSSYSCDTGNCVEIATSDGWIGVRDSKDPTGPVLGYPVSDWQRFVSTVRGGAFDV